MSPDVEVGQGVSSRDTPRAPGDVATAPAMTGPPGILFRVFRDQRVLFLVVGGVNTVVGTAWFALFDGLIGHRWNGFGHYPALVLTYIVAILCAFVLYRTVVFRVRGHVIRDLMRFSLVHVTAFFVNLAHDPRVRLLRTPAGGGAPANWGRVTEAATGTYLKLVCGDSSAATTCSSRRASSGRSRSSTVAPTSSSPLHAAC